jgi:hypothetical protein
MTHCQRCFRHGTVRWKTEVEKLMKEIWKTWNIIMITWSHRSVEASHHLECSVMNAVHVHWRLGVDVLLPSSGWNFMRGKKQSRSKRQNEMSRVLLPAFLIGLLLDPKDGGCNFLRNVSGLREHYILVLFTWARGSIVVEALSNKPEGRGIASRWGEFFFSNLPNPCGFTMALGSTQPLAEMNTRNLEKRNLGVKCGRRVGLTTMPLSVNRFSK